MVATFLGALLLVIPFLLILYFKDRLLGFLYIFTGLTVFHLSVALLSQALHLFNYSLIIIINSLLALGSLVFLLIKKSQINWKLKFNWLVPMAALIIIFELFSVHYLYSGESIDINGLKQVRHQSYVYPYFPDEWAGVAFINYTINYQSLPIVNPMWGNDKLFFPNIFVVFFAGLSELFLSLNLSPLLGYPIISIVSGTLVGGLVFLFLKSIKTKTFFAVLAALCLPLVVNSVKLPGIWYLFPFIAGTIFLLASLTAINLRSPVLFLVNSLLSLLFYPPFIVFIAPVLLYYLLDNKKTNLKKAVITFSGLLAVVGAAVLIIFLIQPSNTAALLDFFIKNFVRNNNEGCIPVRPLWVVIPFWLLPLALVGIGVAVKKKLYYFLIPLMVGLLYWLVYAYCPYFLIIDYARIASIASYLVIIAIGLGSEFTYDWLAEKYKILKNKKIILALSIIIILAFTVSSFFYTQRSAWTKIVLRYDTDLGIWEAPKHPPVNQYLQADDLRLFTGLKQQIFYAPPWKGLVIGASTGNYPLESKASTISNHFSSYELFMGATCLGKTMLAEDSKLDYLYSTAVDCPGFELVGSSQEGLYLYKFHK